MLGNAMLKICLSLAILAPGTSAMVDVLDDVKKAG